MADSGGAPGLSQAAAARAAFLEKEQQAKKSDQDRASESMSARQMAMANLAKGGVVSRSEAAGRKGETQHSAAVKAFGATTQTEQKVIPNWKLSSAQRAAIEEKKEMRKGGESQMASAMKAFGGMKAFEAAGATAKQHSTPRTFVPTAKTDIHHHYGGGGGTSGGATSARARTVSAPPSSAAAAAAAPPPENIVRAGGMGGGAAEAEEGVEHDLKLLVAGIVRLGVADADGSVVAPFGKIVDDEELEQQLESLVGTLKAGRRR